MKNSNNTYNLKVILFLVTLITISNGCGIIEGTGEWTTGFEFFERTVFDSLSGLYK